MTGSEPKKRNFYEELEPRTPNLPWYHDQRILEVLVILGITVAAGTLSVLLLSSSRKEITLDETSNNDKTTERLPLGQVRTILGAPPSFARPNNREEIIVSLDQGKLRGFEMKSRGNRTFLAFLGIPYAKPPLGDLRFKPPENPENWEGIHNGTKTKMACPQIKLNSSTRKYELYNESSEDCLYLNLYTPKPLKSLRTLRGRLPVMVYIHGGIGNGDGSRYGANYFMDEDVILITVNYRLGIIGNLNTGDLASRGNFGLKDQIRALEWTRDNVHFFGGNKRKVTLFGNSYGSMQTTAHLISPMSKGLFHRTIGQSGTLLYPTIMNRKPKSLAYRIGEGLNCSLVTSIALVNCLRGIDLSTLLLKGKELGLKFEISVEPGSLNNETLWMESVIPDEPYKLLLNGSINPVSSIHGVNSGEGLYNSLGILSSENATAKLNKDWELVLPELLTFKTSPSAENISDVLRAFYLQGEDGTANRHSQENLTNLFSDRLYIHPAKIFGSHQSKNNDGNPVYLYYFTKKGPTSYADGLEEVYDPNDEETFGPAHADELQWLFPFDKVQTVKLGTKDGNFSVAMISLWTTFAKSGNPVPRSSSFPEWNPLSPNGSDPKPWFHLDDTELMVMFNPIGDRMAVWDSFNLTELYY